MGRKVWVPTVSGPLAPCAAGFASWLKSRAYSPSATADRLYQFDQLSRWLEREGLAVGELTDEQAERFAAGRRGAGLVMWAAPHSALLPLGYLRELGVAPAPAPVAARGPLEELLADYRRYLSVQRRLSDHTVLDAYEPAARLFLAGREGPDGLGLEQLSSADVSSFLARECPQRSASGARDLVCALRSFLRYLHVAGLIEASLVWAVPSVADLRDRTLPRGLDPAAVRRLLARCDRRRLVGRRDYAILLLLVRLGLRAGEVAAIQLEDVDWRRGELLVRGKGSRYDVLPLPVDVGEAIVAYLRRRPPCECRALFLRVTAPLQGLNRCTVSWVVRAACDRAGLARVGPHRLRHTAATEMLRAGASLPEIGQVLRHREPRIAPYIYTDGEIAALMAAAGELSPALRAARHQTLIGLLAVTGMRPGEALALDRQDVDLRHGVVHVRAGKQRKQRQVPLHETTIGALGEYARHRDARFPTPSTPAFFISARGRRMAREELNRTFTTLIRQVGLDGRGARARPRPHDLRHAFTVRTLLDWHEAGENIDRRMPLLSTYLGHVDPASTYWYLEAVPELLESISRRLPQLTEVLS